MIDILLATYNGENFLDEQIKSVLEQTYEEFNLIIRDDFSCDNTLAIINKYVSKWPDKIKLLKDENKKNLGIKENFNSLLSSSHSDYVMFSDQDDVWLPEKVEMTLKKMREMEALYGNNIPILIHTDLKVTDKNLNILNESFFAYQKLSPHEKSLNRLLVQNVITGCTVMINRKLADLAFSIPEEAIMHDWWAGLIASSLGQIGYLPQSTVLYRQHEGNDTGAKAWGMKLIIKKIINFPEIKESLKKTQIQAFSFLNRYKNLLSKEDREILSVYSSFNSMNFFKKRFYMFKYGFFKIGLMRNIGFFLSV